ncbi:MAG: hypothetical protein H7834_10905 [Magnetococcus sp. YQC-9]
MIGMTINTDTPEQLADILAMFNPASLKLRINLFGPVDLDDEAPVEEEQAPPKKAAPSAFAKPHGPILSREERAALLNGLGDGTGDVAQTESAGAPVQETVEKPATTPPVADKPVRKGRPRKTEESAASPAEQLPEPTTSPAETASTIDDVRAAMTRVSEGVGIMAVKTLLEKFGVKRIGELEQARYNDFLVAAAEVKA